MRDYERPAGTAGASCAIGTSQISGYHACSFSTEYPWPLLKWVCATLGISINGLTNVIGSGYNYDNIDGQARMRLTGVPAAQRSAQHSEHRCWSGLGP